MDLKQFQKMKDRVEELRQNAARAEGRLSQLLERLESTYECSTQEQAEELLVQWEKDVKEAEAVAEASWEDFLEKWGHLYED